MIHLPLRSDPVRRNFSAFVWHATWLSVTSAFTEINTVLPSLILMVGGREIHVGVLTAIMVGTPFLTQLLFAAFLGNKRRKKPFLLLGIYLRVFALAGSAWTLFRFDSLTAALVILLVYVWMLVFSTSGSFAGISHTDILGRSIQGTARRRFFGIRQFLSSWGLLASAVFARQILKTIESPESYMILLSAASTTLFVASFGFWAIREPTAEIVLPHMSLKEVFRQIPQRLKESSNLRNYILISNLVGFTSSLGPFYVVLARDRFNIDAETVGEYLLAQIGGMIVGSLAWSRLLNRTRFKVILRFALPLLAIVPLLALTAAYLLPAWTYLGVFILGGICSSGLLIGIEGAFLEITDESNRVLFSGIRGTFNIVIAIFPLVVGSIVTSLGYLPVFAASSATVFVALFLLERLVCPLDPKKETP